MSNKEIHLVGPLGIPTSCGLDEIEVLGKVGSPAISKGRKKGTEYYNLTEVCFVYFYFVSPCSRMGIFPVCAKDVSGFYRMQ